MFKKLITSDPYILDTNEDGFPIFTKKNLSFLNAVLDMDSNYRDSQDSTDSNFKNSYAGLLKENGVPKDFDLMESIVKSIDKINSTHLSSEGILGGNQGIQITTSHILKIDKLEERLSNKDAKLVSLIACAVKNETQNSTHPKNKTNFSFATKFCAYSSLHALNQDNYCIYDKVVQNILPYYAYIYLEDDSYYKTKRTGENCSIIKELFQDTVDYKGYRDLIDKIIEAIETDSGLKISYKDFDNLLWYYYKGTETRIKKAMKLLPAK